MRGRDYLRFSQDLCISGGLEVLKCYFSFRERRGKKIIQTAQITLQGHKMCCYLCWSTILFYSVIKCSVAPPPQSV